MTHKVTANGFKSLLIPALILLAIGSLTNPVRAQIVTTNGLIAADGASSNDLGYSVSASGSYLAVSAPFKTLGSNTYQGSVYIYEQSGSGWVQQAEITSEDGGAYDEFGSSVCLSGTTLVVGAPEHTINGNTYQGAVYIYTRSGSSWVQQAEITSADGGAYDLFGFSVSLSGTNLAIGAPNHTLNGNLYQGTAYIFAHSGSSWTQKAEIISADGAEADNFGWTVSLAGTTVAVGATSHAVNGNGVQGATYVYLHSGTTWKLQAELTSADGGEGDQFGYSLSLSGNILAIGAPFHSPSSSLPDQGAAYVYIRSGTTWTLQAELMAADGAAYDDFGWSLSFSGTTLAVSGPFHTVGSNTNQGVVYTYLHSGPNWILQQEQTEQEGATLDSFGYSVSLNGSVLAVGAPTKTINGNTYQGEVTVFVTGSAELTATGGAANDLMGYSVSLYSTILATGAPFKKVNGKADAGAVFVYSHSGTTWTQQAELTAADGASTDYFGYSVSVNGNTLVVGAPYHTVNGIESGAVYVYTLSGTTWTLQAELTAADAAGGDNFGHAVSLNGATLAIGASYKTVGSNPHQGVVYIFNRSGTTWTKKAELVASDGGPNFDQFGYSVCLTSTNLAVGSPFHEVGSNYGQGAAYVFTHSGSSWTQTGEVTAGDGGYDDYFGWSVGLEYSASTGSTLLVGAPYHTVGTTSYQQGAVYSYFATTGSTYWIETSELIAPDGVSGDYFGLSLSLNGSSLIVGAPYKDIDGDLEQGAAYVYSEVGSEYYTGWNNTSELTAKDGKTDDVFGYSVCVSGTNFAIGAPEHKVKNNSDQGVVYTLP